MDPVILGALIALISAAFGTLLQVHLVHRQRTWARVESIRSAVNRLGASCLSYTTLMYQRAHDAIEYDQMDGIEDHLKLLSDKLTEAFNQAIQGCFELMACGEPRIIDRAEALHHALIKLQNTWAPHGAGRTATELARLDKERKEALEDINILLNMVQPRIWERIWVFRSQKAAKNMLVKLRATRNAESGGIL